MLMAGAIDRTSAGKQEGASGRSDASAPGFPCARLVDDDGKPVGPGSSGPRPDAGSHWSRE